MRTSIVIEGKVQSTSKGGTKAQISVKNGAYRGTYHCVYSHAIQIGNQSFQEWHTVPNKQSADQYRIITEEGK